MALKDYIFTSESVSEGHPDKVADQISDAILDAFIANDVKLGHADDSHANTRLGCETLVTTNKIVIAGEHENVHILLADPGIAVSYRVQHGRSDLASHMERIARVNKKRPANILEHLDRSLCFVEGDLQTRADAIFVDVGELMPRVIVRIRNE